MDQQAADASGMASVDEVLRQVSALSERPVAEHVAVFERAHEQLRRALDARPDTDMGDGRSA